MTVSRVSRTAAVFLELVLAGAILLVTVFGVAQPLLGPSVLGVGTGSIFGAYPAVDVTIDPAAVKIETTPELPSLSDRGEVARGEAIELTLPTGSTAAVYDPDLAQGLGLIGSEVLRAMLTIAVLALLLLLVRSLRHGDPFVPANARRLYAIAAVVGLGGQAAVLLEWWGRTMVMEHPLVAPYVLEGAHISFAPLLAGLGIAVAAEVFRQGAELRREVEGLV